MKETRMLGGLGAISLFLGFIPNAGIVFEIIGMVLLLIAISQLSSRFRDKRIFNNFLIGFIIGIISYILVFVSVGSLLLGIIFEGEELASGSILILVVAYILSIVGYYNWKKSLNLVSLYTNVGYFKTAGNLYFWGAITLIVLVGFILSFIANIILAVAFFNLFPFES